MKYPFENATVWDLIRHPFDEESGDPGGLTCKVPCLSYPKIL